MKFKKVRYIYFIKIYIHKYYNKNYINIFFHLTNKLTVWNFICKGFPMAKKNSHLPPSDSEASFCDTDESSYSSDECTEYELSNYLESEDEFSSCVDSEDKISSCAESESESIVLRNGRRFQKYKENKKSQQEKCKIGQGTSKKKAKKRKNKKGKKQKLQRSAKNKKKVIKKNTKNQPKKPVKKVKKSASWTPGLENRYVNNPPSFKGKYKINIRETTPFQFFRKLFPEQIIDIICLESNRYARECGENDFVVTNKDIEIFLGINIMMTYIKYPKLRMYWHGNQLRCNAIAELMSCRRFEEIKKFLHFVQVSSLSDDQKINKYFRIQPILDILHKTFLECVDPPEHQSIDEMLIPFKGKSQLKQYLKNKPKKWGFKFWIRASPGGYVHKFEGYQSSTVEKSIYGPVGDSVIRLCQGLENKNHKLFMDNLFTSDNLLQYFQSKEIFVLGTVQLNRFPQIKENLVELKKLKLSRGSTSLATSKDNVTIVRWLDNREVHTASTYAGVEPTSFSRKWDKKSKARISVEMPFCISEYRNFMGGVDFNDRMVAHYPHGFKSKKWYLRIFFHFLNVALVNAWICYKQEIEDTTFLEFKSAVAHALMLTESRKRSRGRPSEIKESDETPYKKPRTTFVKILDDIRYDNMGHYPVKSEKKNASRCHSICKKKTRYLCKKCKVPVCPECMESFHTE